MESVSLWLRWSWRDLRRRWLMVSAIALIIAIGVGVYAGFGSMADWRRRSNDLSYARLHMYDVHVRLSAGTFAQAGELAAAAASIPDARLLNAVEERLIVPVQVDASSGETILVHGELVGLDIAGGGPNVNVLHVGAGRALGPADSGQDTAILHSGFADAHHLPPSGTVRVSGGTPLSYVGTGLTPDYFIITARTAGLVPVGNLSTYAVLFASLPTVQRVAGLSGQVNDLVLTVRSGADPATIKSEVEAAFAARLPGVSATAVTRGEDEAHRVLYDDIGNDQQLVNVLALLVIGGAALAAFNLTSRLVEAQRREIGVGMALGVGPWKLAMRPLLFSAQVAVVGAIAGIPIGLAVNQALKPLLRNLLPLPYWEMPFETGTYLRAAAVGFAIPFLATALPVLRAVRTEPASAIRAGFLTGGSSGLAPLVRHLPLPGDSIAQMPLRNVLRTPRRTLLTALAIGAAVTALVGTLGLIDTFNHFVDRGTAETSRTAADRLDVLLDGFYPGDGGAAGAIRSSSAVGRAEFGLRVDGEARAKGRPIGLQIDLLDFASAMWTPSIVGGGDVRQATDGIVLARKAADDLGVRAGDTLLLRHPRRIGEGYQLVETPVRVAGVHNGPLRFSAYMDLRQADLFGLAGLVNLAQVQPAAGVSATTVQRALFAVPGLALTQPVSATGAQLRDVLRQFYDILRIAEVAALAICLLIGFNAMSIATDERAREHAAMFAMGLPVRAVVRINLLESATIGVLGTIIGLPVGFAVLSLMVRNTVSATLPDLSLQASLASSTIVIGILGGVVAVTLGPLFSLRRLERMDIPATLRVVE